MANITIGGAFMVALLGYAVVFFGLILLMLVITAMGKVMARSAVKPVEVDPKALEPEHRPVAPGTAGEIKLYDTDPRSAAMIMAIVADALGKPLNELRFLSIREVTE